VFYPVRKFYFWIHVNVVFLLTWIGARPVEDPYIFIGQFLSVVYFIYYFVNVGLQLIWDYLLGCSWKQGRDFIDLWRLWRYRITHWEKFFIIASREGF
jgi:hypothetical protein